MIPSGTPAIKLLCIAAGYILSDMHVANEMAMESYRRQTGQF